MHDLPGRIEPNCPFECACTRGLVVCGNLRRPSKSHSERLSRNIYAWAGLAALRPLSQPLPSPPPPRMLYTAEERSRRNASRWTVVQGVLAPLQFVVFLVSVFLVLSYLATGEGLVAATMSIVAKTFILYVIMVTGSLWEHDVYGRYLFAPAFFWEDAVSMLVLALHTAYLGALATGWLSPRGQMFLALAAYVAYVVNATQFVLKLRAARRGQQPATGPSLVECTQ
jgi:3-vinyl bacteriochlorophyllide hydratase